MQDTESLESEFDDGHNDSRADDQYMRDEEEFLECANDGCIYNWTSKRALFDYEYSHIQARAT